MTTLAKLTKEEITALSILVAENQNSAKLQKSSGLSYMDSINLGSKLEEIIQEFKKAEWIKSQEDLYLISYDYHTSKMLITDKVNNIIYKIDEELVHEGVIFNQVENRTEAINSLEMWISETHSDSDKILMREDLRTLQESDDEYVFNNYGTNGFITKNDIEAFNKVCLEVIESFKEHKSTIVAVQLKKLTKIISDWEQRDRQESGQCLDEILEILDELDADLREYIIEADGDELTDVQAIELVVDKFNINKGV